MTKLKFINHASVLIKSNNIGLLSDPWYFGTAFHDGWNLLYENKKSDIRKILEKEVTHIWISHEHPDHFSIPFFKTFDNILKERKIPILFQKTDDKRVKKFISSMGLNLIELEFNLNFKLTENFLVTCIKDGFYDSGLLIETEKEKILNLNDCEINTDERLIEVYKITGKVDVLLTQFSYAAWKGGPENLKWQNDAALEKLETINKQINKFNPKLTIPFASFIWFSNSWNKYLNGGANNASMVFKRFESSENKIIFLKPYEEIITNKNMQANMKSIGYWDELIHNSKNNPVNIYQSIKINELKENFAIYCDRIEKNNSISLMKFFRFFKIMGSFQDTIIFLKDINKKISINYVNKEFKEVKHPPDLIMHSASINFIFKNSFGFDTLTVNGCFLEGKNGGFEKATKNLAIENLNNLGINFNLKIIFNPKIINLFIDRLKNVRKKLSSS